MSRRRRKRGHPVVYVASAVTAGLALAGHGHHHHHGGVGVPDSVAAAPIPSGSSYTPRSWARELLWADGLHRTACNVNAIVAWESAEDSNPAWHNLLDTTQTEPGSVPVNSVGVQSFRSWGDGLRATAATLNNGLYGGILAALHVGNDAQSIADAVTASPWGTGSFTATC